MYVNILCSVRVWQRGRFYYNDANLGSKSSKVFIYIKRERASMKHHGYNMVRADNGCKDLGERGDRAALNE